MYHALPNDMVMLCYTGSAVPFPSQLSQLLSWSSRGLDGRGRSVPLPSVLIFRGHFCRDEIERARKGYGVDHRVQLSTAVHQTSPFEQFLGRIS